jgi:hypothetical protein
MYNNKVDYIKMLYFVVFYCMKTRVVKALSYRGLRSFDIMPFIITGIKVSLTFREYVADKVLEHNEGISRTPSFPYFLPSPFLTCCGILSTSFGGTAPPSDGLLAEVFWSFPQL